MRFWNQVLSIICQQMIIEKGSIRNNCFNINSDFEVAYIKRWYSEILLACSASPPLKFGITRSNAGHTSKSRLGRGLQQKKKNIVIMTGSGII